MLFLLLIQMFPQVLAVVAIYLIVSTSATSSRARASTRSSRLILVYLGGAMGVNTWLMKGFFDTIPSELDESARVDGATPAQIFWGVVLPLAAPVLAVVALLSFVVHDQRVRDRERAAADRRTSFTLPVGLQRLHRQRSTPEHWGPFAAGVLLAAIPVAMLFFVAAAVHRQRPHPGAVKG